MAKNNQNHHLKYIRAAWRVRLPLKEGIQKEVNTGFGFEEIEKARTYRDRLLLPFQIQETATAIEVVSAMRKTTGEKLAEAQRSANRIKVQETWDKFPYTESSGRGLKKGVRKLTPRGVLTARQQWHEFEKWAEETGREYLDQIGAEEAKQYSSWLVNVSKVAPATHNKYLNTAGVLFRNATGTNPFDSVQRRRVVSQSRRPLDKEEIAKIWEALDRRIEAKEDIVYSVSRRGLKFTFPQAVGSEETALRKEDKKLFGLLLYSGMRLSDCVTLTGEHFWGGEIHRTTSKDEKNLGFPVVKKLKEILGTIPAREPILPLLYSDFVRHGKTKNISNRMARVLDSCGFERLGKRRDGKVAVSLLGAHALRHTFVQICRDANVDIESIRKWIGHTSSIITAIYSQNSKQDMQRIADAIQSV